MKILTTIAGQKFWLQRGTDINALVNALQNAVPVDYVYSRKEGEPQYHINEDANMNFMVELVPYNDIGYKPGSRIEKTCAQAGADKTAVGPAPVEAPSGATETAPF